MKFYKCGKDVNFFWNRRLDLRIGSKKWILFKNSSFLWADWGKFLSDYKLRWFRDQMILLWKNYLNANFPGFIYTFLRRRNIEATLLFFLDQSHN